MHSKSYPRARRDAIPGRLWLHACRCRVTNRCVVCLSWSIVLQRVARRHLHAHTSVLAVVGEQMRDWNAAATDQADDYLDCAAGAILAEPVRIGQTVAPPREKVKEFGLWRPASQVYEAQLEDRVGELLAGRSDDEPEPRQDFQLS